ncbi:uncharacterized protein LOC119284004 [Triticum dicoccoides]|uniref:uncharacterized protein LOC119284004 n=1 Tax=Triticum dicoccoides TaxID=85692 RepID=UPI00188F369B|nr:uncharacterized protein LOC119284004 [Triticum dicoccoides]XP_044361093.1 uncharacterized protein LOC123082989 [Triticum aestivum]
MAHTTQQERDATTRELLRQLVVLKSTARTPVQQAISRELLQPLLEFHPLLARTTAVIKRGAAAVAREQELLAELGMAMQLPESASVPELRARLLREARLAAVEAELALRETKLALRESETRLDFLESVLESWERRTDPGRTGESTISRY